MNTFVEHIIILVNNTIEEMHSFKLKILTKTYH